MTDFVIIGAGSAGCVLADRLSAQANVVLLEAGGSDRVNEVAIPAAFSKLFNTAKDWGFNSLPEPNAHSRSLYLPRGKMLGGCSSINSGLYIRGRPSDYDGWASQGAKGWSWDAVLPVFKAMEGNTRGADAYHGDSGPLIVDDLRSPNELSRRFVEAAIQTGISANNDFNGERQEGAGLFQVTQKRGRRWSAADVFLRPAMSRPTLEVVSEAMVTRILFDRGKAVGVEFAKDGGLHKVDASSEVIVAAGTFGSPHLLQVSGLGDPEHLAQVGVDVVDERPGIGTNLQDHPVVGMIYDSLFAGTLDDAETPLEIIRWLALRTGRLTSPVAEACAFTRSDPGLAEPDLQFHFGPASFDDHGRASYPANAFSFGPVLVNPKSRGWVKATSPDATVGPEIQTNVLTEPDDLIALREGMQIGRQIVSQPALGQYRGEEIYPGAGVRTTSDLDEFIRSRVELLYHPVGTCRMGNDLDAVVDERLRVNGVDRLRVIDASIMPTIVSGNTNAPTMMIAERGAEMVIADHRV